MKYRMFNEMDFNIESKISDFETILGFKFNNTELLKQSLTHRSYDHIHSNERMEFLGDAILSFIISKKLYDKYNDKTEGEMTQMRSSLVSRETLYEVGKQMHLDLYLIVGEGTQITPSIISCTYEAVIGAIYLDNGIEKVEEFIENTLLTYRSLDNIDINDYKSSLQQYTTQEYHSYPQYTVEKEEGPDHQKIYTISVKVNGKTMGIGVGKSKKEAEQKAAEEAMKKINPKKE